MTYRLFCDYCGFKRFTDGTDLGDLRSVSYLPMQGKIDAYDPKEKKTLRFDGVERQQKFKCPSCGRLLRSKQIPADGEKP